MRGTIVSLANKLDGLCNACWSLALVQLLLGVQLQRESRLRWSDAFVKQSPCDAATFIASHRLISDSCLAFTHYTVLASPGVARSAFSRVDARFFSSLSTATLPLHQPTSGGEERGESGSMAFVFGFCHSA